MAFKLHPSFVNFCMCFVLPSANMCPVVSLWQGLIPLISNTLLILTWIIISVCEIMFALKFRLCNLSPCSMSLDDQTIVHFWAPKNKQLNRPDLVLIHGYGGNSRWQFYQQVGPLSRRFNHFIPDLLFFGKSNTKRTDRSDVFQAKCVREGLKRLGVTRFSVAGISYGGYVAFRMAEIYPKEVEKVVIVSCGICYTEDQKHEELKRIGRNPLELLLPEKPQDLRCLINMCVYKSDPLKWLPDFFLSNTVKVMCKNNRKEIIQIGEYLMTKEADSNLGVLSQETLIVWGDKDNVFPLKYAYQLQRHLGSKAKVEIIENTGHAVNLDSPVVMSHLIISFVLG